MKRISHQLTCSREACHLCVQGAGILSFPHLRLWTFSKCPDCGIISFMRLLRDRIKGFFLPTFSELSLFMMSLSFLLVLFFSKSMRSGLFKFLTGPRSDPRIFMLLVFFGAGLALSIFHVFTEREKTNPEKYAMLFFAVVSNAVSGIFASVYILKQSSDSPGILLLLPIWNIINCILLLISFRAGLINERNISDEDATHFEVLFGFLITVVIFIVCRFVFKLYWAITFSICVIYATSFSDALGSVFHPERRQLTGENVAVDGEVRPAGKSETCGFCGRQISPAETPWVVNRKLIVCKDCYDKIKGKR